MGLLYSGDLDRIQLNHLKEAAKLRGTEVLFFETIEENKNLYTDIEIQSFDKPMKVNILFERYPQNRKTLQREGWYNKDADDNPDTAYVPLDLDILRRWQEVLLPARIVDYNQELGWRRYHITKISTTMDHPFYYLVAMAPVFTDLAPKIDRTKNSNFIDFSKIEE